jgi:hypothetical protein
MTTRPSGIDLVLAVLAAVVVLGSLVFVGVRFWP